MAKSTKQPPRWDCRDEKDRESFEAWTNAQLDEMFEPSAADIRREQVLFSDSKFPNVLEQEASERLKRGRVIMAARAGDYDMLARLADTEDLRQLAFRRRKPGRAKGEPRPRDLPQTTKWCCEEALADVDRIHQLWKNKLGKCNRSAAPTAMEIAARRCGVDVDVLDNFKKNRHRNRRS
jgi:hypothetical protein